MRPRDLAPHNSDLRASDLLGGSVDVSNTLTEVELGVLRIGHTLDLDQRHIWIVHFLGSLVRQVLALNIQSVRLRHRFGVDVCECKCPWC